MLWSIPFQTVQVLTLILDDSPSLPLPMQWDQPTKPYFRTKLWLLEVYREAYSATYIIHYSSICISLYQTLNNHWMPLNGCQVKRSVSILYVVLYRSVRLFYYIVAMIMSMISSTSESCACNIGNTLQHTTIILYHNNIYYNYVTSHDSFCWCALVPSTTSQVFPCENTLLHCVVLCLLSRL